MNGKASSHGGLNSLFTDQMNFVKTNELRPYPFNSRVRRMARNLEMSTGVQSSSSSTTTTTTKYTHVQPRSVDQLARFNSITDLPSRLYDYSDKNNHNHNWHNEASWYTYENQHENNFSQSMNQLHLSSDESQSSTLVPSQVRRRPCVIIKETISPEGRFKPRAAPMTLDELLLQSQRAPPTRYNQESDYPSPRSTGSSMASGTSAFSAPAAYHQKQSSVHKQSWDGLEELPNFARHTESSWRRSKLSASIPEGLNTLGTKHSQSNQSFFATREPQGEYHVLKKWCESLRKYGAKDQEKRKRTQHQEPRRSDQMSKSVSFETLADSQRCPSLSSSVFKFSNLDTVSEEQDIGAVMMRPKKTLLVQDDQSMNRYFSEVNLSLQCKTLGTHGTCSDILVGREHLPLRYKRDSWVKRYGPEESANCLHQPINKIVELEPDAEPQFERRNVIPRKGKTPFEDYTFGEFLGRGKFGEVKRCNEKRTQKQLAAKFVPVRSENDRSSVYNEIDVMNNLQHPRLLQLYEAFDCGKEIVLIMELISGGELFERVIDDDFILTEVLCELYVRQICEGIAFMHKENFLHLDMKPENILCINRDGHRIKIIDFGLARKFRPGDSLRILFGTPEFVAPEVVSYEKIGQGTDLWSVGVICYVLLSGLSPFMGDNDAETYNNINHVEYDFDDDAFEDISEDAKDFISKLLRHRLTAEQCLKHRWLTRHSNQLPSDVVENVKINTRKLKRFVIRRRWQHRWQFDDDHNPRCH